MRKHNGICKVCGRRRVVVYLRASGEYLCARCLSRRIERKVSRRLKSIAGKSIVIGFETTGTIALMHILAKVFKEGKWKIYSPENSMLLEWAIARYKFEKVHLPLIGQKTSLILPFTLEEFSSLLLKWLLKLDYRELVNNRIIAPLSSFSIEQLEVYASYRKLPIVPVNAEEDVYGEIFSIIEESTPTIRYQFLSSIKNVKNLVNKSSELHESI